jgi:hypothetical protein
VLDTGREARAGEVRRGIVFAKHGSRKSRFLDLAEVTG